MVPPLPWFEGEQPGVNCLLEECLLDVAKVEVFVDAVRMGATREVTAGSSSLSNIGALRGRPVELSEETSG